MIIQLALDFTLSSTNRVITPLMERIEKILYRLAKRGGEMPTNPTLSELVGDHDRSSVFRTIKRLQRAGRLRIEQEPRRRRVVFPDGLATGWGESRPGHAPYCSNKRGEVPDQLKVRERLPQSLPLPAKIIPAIYREPISIGRTQTCLWPMWSDDEKPNGCYCDAPVLARKSYCELHAQSSSCMQTAQQSKTPKVFLCQGSTQ